jgi:hypothetical protein
LAASRQHGVAFVVESGGTMSIESKVRPVVAAFKKENPSAKDVVFTGSDRSADDELGLICERPTQYPVIGKAFRGKFKAEIPSAKTMEADQKKWCLCFINGLAGKAGAYAHVGGKAQDLRVKDLTIEERRKLDGKLKKAGFKILYETIAGSKSNYHATIENTTHFHVYVD